MGHFVQRNGFVGQQALWAAIAKELSQNGMQIISVDGSVVAPTIGDSIDSVVLQATTAIDPLATSQPWRLAIKVTDDSVRMYAATPLQITDAGDISVVNTIQASSTATLSIYSGTIGNYLPEMYTDSACPANLRDTFFYHKGAFKNVTQGEMYAKGSMQFSAGAGPSNLCRSSDSAIPFSYMVSISDHGIAVGTMVEGQDNQGCRNNWFTIQRPIDAEGNVVTTGAAPLFCTYSVSGGGSPDADTVWAAGIMRFTVREAEVNAPALATSAVSHTPDSFSVMNPIQQVAMNENTRYDFRFPSNYNTHSRSYPYEMDMIGYGSADTSSTKLGIELQVYNEVDGDGAALNRKYRAFAANSPKNTGMRLFFLEQGGGV